MQCGQPIKEIMDRGLTRVEVEVENPLDPERRNAIVHGSGTAQSRP